jgi:hypothetical protein
MATLWQTLYETKIELAISGHDHDYERLTPLDGAGNPDREHGVRQFVVGTGGRKTRDFTQTRPNSEVRVTGVFGVRKLTLSPGRYAWEFVPAAGETFRDSGAGVCHSGREEVCAGGTAAGGFGLP